MIRKDMYESLSQTRIRMKNCMFEKKKEETSRFAMRLSDSKEEENALTLEKAAKDEE